MVGKPELKGPLGRPGRRQKDSIGMDIRETGWKDVNGIRVRIGSNDELLLT
jgi:hypothetical protein